MIYLNKWGKRHHANNVKLGQRMNINLWVRANVLIKTVDIFCGMHVRLTPSLMILLKNLRLLSYKSLEKYPSLFSRFLLISRSILIILKMSHLMLKSRFFLIKVISNLFLLRRLLLCIKAWKFCPGFRKLEVCLLLRLKKSCKVLNLFKSLWGKIWQGVDCLCYLRVLGGLDCKKIT